MPADRKRKIVGDRRRRLLTIHDGTRLTPTVVRILDAIASDVTEYLEAGLDEEPSCTPHGPRRQAVGYTRRRLDPVLVARSDGLVVYVDDDDRLLG